MGAPNASITAGIGSKAGCAAAPLVAGAVVAVVAIWLEGCGQEDYCTASDMYV